ncbi:hypothetical protein H257_13835 [Aphanomyces astaci]|uniref:CBM1 domain-containing protein n=1 Tax=Aphanomyces astaci TaxID=112090 RepID=W4FUW6_APHAT|nr:hypothetical protein H257_13835 [Aphanomyces astaci]ETV70746.1 hypothetical protein H257_13835 [Aphanomyces astaci]RQM25551.1 hypothetical protein B5M09_008430 [Aphanomyces astaci]|eukprot:XP_009839810.1 hypothetical protein H257_13835 [Aphanomyces astaci]
MLRQLWVAVGAALCVVVAATDHVHLRNQAATCTSVSVVGDATYCIDTATICGGTVGACPKQGDVASADCLPTLKSYFRGDGSTAECIAPVDAECKAIPSGVLGCVFPSTISTTSPPHSSSLPPVPSTTSIDPTTIPHPTDEAVKVCSEDWGQCGGQSRTQRFSNCCHNATFACKAFNVYYSQCLPTVSTS